MIRLYGIVLLLLNFLVVGIQAAEIVLKSSEGVPLKVIVRDNGAIFEQPDNKSKSIPVSKFQFFYCVGLPDMDKGDEGKGKTKNGFYRVANSGKGESKSVVGWIAKDLVVEWPHRQALGFLPKSTGKVERELGSFYESKEILEKSFVAGNSKAPEPISKEPAAGVGTNLMPILDLTDIKVNGDKLKAYRVAYLQSRGSTSSSSPSSSTNSNSEQSNPETVDLKKMTLDVVFVIDTTNSMQPAINAVKESVKNISKELLIKAPNAKIRYGLVGYRDKLLLNETPPDWYVAKIFCKLDDGADHKVFMNELEKMEAAKIGSEDFPEDVLAGMEVAIKKSNWNPNAFKHIVLIGDASSHDEVDNPKNSLKQTIPGIVSLAVPTGESTLKQKITINSIRIISGNAEDEPKAKRHFEALSQSSAGNGFFNSYNMNNLKPCENKLQEVIVSTLTKTGEVLANPENAAKIIKDAQKSNPNIPGLGLLLEMVRNSGSGEGNSNSFASGFTAEADVNLRQIFEEWVLVDKQALTSYHAAIEFFVSSLRKPDDPGNADTAKTLNSLKLLVTQLNLNEQIDADTEPSKLLSLILGFPVKNKIFSISVNRLAAMSTADYESWIKSVQASQTVTRGMIDNPALWKPLGSGPTSGKELIAFIRIRDLP